MIITSKVKGTSSLLGAAFVVGSFGICARLVSPMLGTVTQTAMRFGLAAAVTGGLFVLVKRRSLKLTRRHLPYVLGLGVGTFALGVLFTVAVNNTKVGTSLSLLFASSIITAIIIGLVFFKEKLSPVKVVAISLTLLGLVIYAQPLAAIGIGVIAGLAAGLCDGVCNGLRKKLSTADRGLVVLYQYGLAALCTTVCIFPSGEVAIKSVSLPAILALALYVLLSVGLGNLLLQGFSRLDVNIGAIILASQIFFATGLGMIFLYEVPTLSELTGAVLIFVSATLIAIDASYIGERLKTRFRWAVLPIRNEEGEDT